MNLRLTWHRIAAGILIGAAVLAIVRTPGIFPAARPAPETSIPAPGDRDLGRSVVAWQQATDAERAAYLRWLTRAGLETRHQSVTAWMRARAGERQQVTSDLLGGIFLALAACSLLLAVVPLFVKRAQAPRRRALWTHAVLGAGILFFTFLFLSVGLRFLVEVTSDVSQLANPEAGLVDAAFDRLEHEAEAALVPAGSSSATSETLPLGPIVGAGDEAYDGGFIANLWRNLQYFDPEAFRPAIQWSHRAWYLLSLAPYVIPWLIALVFLLTMRSTLFRLVRMPFQAGRGEPHSGRRALGEALLFVGREWLAIVLLTLVLLITALLLHLGVRHLSHSLVGLALDVTVTTVSYFGHLTSPPEQPAFTIAILALPAYLLLATVIAGMGLGLFALWARRVTQLKFHQGIPLRAHGGFWRRGLFAVVCLQWIPVLVLWAVAAPLAELHEQAAGDAAEALDRLTTTALVLGVALLLGLALFGGVRSLLYLLRFRPTTEGGRKVAYALRASTPDDHDFLRQAHHEGLRPWIEAVWGWDEAQQDVLVAEWLERHTPEIVTIRGKDAGYLVVEEGAGSLHLHAIVLLPRYQRRGVGTRLVREVIARGDERGRPVTLQVLRPNPARRLYERLGFEVIEETPERYRMRRPHVG